MSARTLAEILADSRLHDYRNAITATIAGELPEIEVVTHPGKIDIADIVQGDAFLAPSIHVALTDFTRPTNRVSGLYELPVKVTAYIVTEDTSVNEKLVKRDELALAMANAITDIVADDQLSRWGLADIAPPEEIEFRPLLTLKKSTAYSDRGTAYYAVSWRQRLTGCGRAFWEPNEMPPPILPPGLAP